MKGNHTLQSKEQNVIQSHASMQASYGLEGPPVKQTNVLQAKSSIKGTRAHLQVMQPKEKVVGARPSRPSYLVG